MTNKQPEGYGEGIYFDMDNELYHRDHAVGRTGIVKILISDYDFWESSGLNPMKSYKQTPAMLFGTFAETYLFEEKKFLKLYNVAGGGWDMKKVTISRPDFDNVVESSRLIRKDKAMLPYLMDGYPQVTIIHRDPATGIMLKVRPDWLRPFVCVDLKRLKSLETAKLGWFIHDHGYDIQEVMCIDAVLYAKKMLRSGKFKVFGKVDAGWLKRFMDDTDSEFRFLMQRSTKPYIYRVEYMSQFIRIAARKKVARGLMKYKAAIEKYGVVEWPAGSAEPHEFQQQNLPMRSFEESE